MQIRIQEYPVFYHGNHFLYELERTKVKFELIDSLNNKATYLTKHGLLSKSIPTILEKQLKYPFIRATSS